MKWGHSFPAGGNVEWYRHSGKQFGTFLLKSKQLPQDPEIAY